jgi:hypothetical protein
VEAVDVGGARHLRHIIDIAVAIRVCADAARRHAPTLAEVAARRNRFAPVAAARQPPEVLDAHCFAPAVFINAISEDPQNDLRSQRP